MKKSQKNEIRLYILQLLTENQNVRWQISELAEDNDMDSLEAMEFFEQEVERINKMFNYPEIQLDAN
jgi:DNA integrity scanning protein DisA with diadenylate cyclase activity